MFATLYSLAKSPSILSNKKAKKEINTPNQKTILFSIIIKPKLTKDSNIIDIEITSGLTFSLKKSIVKGSDKNL